MGHLVQSSTSWKTLVYSLYLYGLLWTFWMLCNWKFKAVHFFAARIKFLSSFLKIVLTCTPSSITHLSKLGFRDWTQYIFFFTSFLELYLKRAIMSLLRLFSAGVNFPKSFKLCHVNLKSSEVDPTGIKYTEIMTCHDTNTMYLWIGPKCNDSYRSCGKITGLLFLLEIL